MKKVLLVGGILILFALCVSAQVPSKPFSIYAGGGLSLPSAPQKFKDGHKTGFHGLAGIGVNAAPFIQMVGKVEYQSFSKDWGELYPGVNVSGGKRELWMYGADLRFGVNVPAAPIKPFLLGGIGWAYISERDIPSAAGFSYLTPKNATEFYFNIGGGIELKGGPFFGLFLQGRYINIKAEGDNLVLIPVTLGIKI